MNTNLKSCEIQLIHTFNGIAKDLGIGKETDILLLTRFPIVGYRISYNSTGFLDWITEGKSQKVVMGDCHSDHSDECLKGHCSCCLPHLCYVNDLPTLVSSNLRL